MAIYYITISALTGLGYCMTEKKKKQNRTLPYLAVVFISLVFLCSFRYAIGFDYFSYRDIYEMIAAMPFSAILTAFWYEPLFFIVCKCFNLCGLPFQLLITGVSLFLLFSAVWFIAHYSKSPWMSVYLYITLQFLAYNMNLMRQSIALCFFLFAYPFLKSRRLMPYSACIFFGGLFHNSLWFVFPLYFLLFLKLSRKTTACLLISTLAGYLFFEPLFSLIHPLLPEKYAVYQQTYFWNSSTWEYILPPAAYCLLIYRFRSRISDAADRSIYLNSAFYQCLISLFITKHFILERFAVYPFAFSLIAIPDILASYREDAPDMVQAKQRYRWIMAVFLLFGGAYFVFASVKGFHHVYPYVSLLDKSRSAPAGSLMRSGWHSMVFDEIMRRNLPLTGWPGPL